MSMFESLPEDPSIPPDGNDKSAVLANILRGYEDFTLDVSGRIISSNLEAVNITGYEEWEIMGKNFSLFYSPEDKQNGQPAVDLANAAQQKLIFSAWRLKKKNVSFWALVTLWALRDDDANVSGYKMILKDQTHKLLSTDRVRRFRDEYLNLFNNSLIGIFKFKLSDFRFILINTKANEIINGGKNSVRFNEIFLNNQELRSFIQTLNIRKEVQGFEFQVNVAAVERWARIDCKLFESDGFVEGVLTDITESKKHILELKQVNDDLDNFIYRASHDLRSPLTTMMGLVNLAVVDPSDNQKYISMIGERISYLDELLKELTYITFNRKADVQINSIDFNSVFEMLRKEFLGRHTHISLNFKVQRSLPILSDDQRIQMIFRYLISIAIRYHNPHAVLPYIDVSVDSDGKQCHIRVEDNGKGIREDQLLPVFGMFYKASDEVRETGLGLYITKLIVDKLRGKISVKSKLGTGSEFNIHLPSMLDQQVENQQFYIHSEIRPHAATGC